MAIPPRRLGALRIGRHLAAPVPTGNAGRVAFVEVIPLCPNPWEHPEAWLFKEHTFAAFASRPVLRSPSSITGYEVRYVEHAAAYTKGAWGLDADLVLADETTRARRVLVTREEEIESALSPWLPDGSGLGHPQDVDSPLVGVYIGPPGRYPHLGWARP